MAAQTASTAAGDGAETDAATGSIFISYRRATDFGHAQSLYLVLERAFPKERLFMDVEGTIRYGDDFVAVLAAQVEACDVLLAVIGPRWLAVEDETGRRRLDDPDDFVRAEITAALERGKRIVPVMVGGAEVPRAADLPEPLRPLARRQAIRLADERFTGDCQSLVGSLREILREAEAFRRLRTEEDREKAEAARREREEAEARRLSEAEEKARQETLAGLSPETIRRAEELHNWDFVRDSGDEHDLRDHLARFPDGPTSRYARAALERVCWSRITPDSPLSALDDFLTEFPDGAHNAEARSLRAHLGARTGVVVVSDDEVCRIAFSPHGNRLATSGTTETVRVWDAATGDEILRIVVWSVPAGIAFSPDGARLATGCADGIAQLWDAATGKEVARLRGHSDYVTSVAFSPGGARLATGSEDRTALIWDAARGEEIVRVVGHSDSVESVAFSPDGARLLTGSWDRSARLWDAARGEEIVRLDGHSGIVRSVAFSPDGTRLATGSLDGTARLWDAATGAEIARLEGHEKAVDGVAFSPDGIRLATGSADGTARLWDAATGAKIARLAGHSGAVTSVAFSPDGARLATGSFDQTVRLWQAREA